MIVVTSMRQALLAVGVASSELENVPDEVLAASGVDVNSQMMRACCTRRAPPLLDALTNKVEQASRTWLHGAALDPDTAAGVASPVRIHRQLTLTTIGYSLCGREAEWFVGLASVNSPDLDARVSELRQKAIDKDRATGKEKASMPTVHIDRHQPSCPCGPVSRAMQKYIDRMRRLPPAAVAGALRSMSALQDAIEGKAVCGLGKTLGATRQLAILSHVLPLGRNALQLDDDAKAWGVAHRNREWGPGTINGHATVCRQTGLEASRVPISDVLVQMRVLWNMEGGDTVREEALAATLKLLDHCATHLSLGGAKHTQVTILAPLPHRDGCRRVHGNTTPSSTALTRAPHTVDGSFAGEVRNRPRVPLVRRLAARNGTLVLRRGISVRRHCTQRRRRPHRPPPPTLPPTSRLREHLHVHPRHLAVENPRTDATRSLRHRPHEKDARYSWGGMSKYSKGRRLDLSHFAAYGPDGPLVVDVHAWVAKAVDALVREGATTGATDCSAAQITARLNTLLGEAGSPHSDATRLLMRCCTAPRTTPAP